MAVLSEVGEVELEVAREREGWFGPRIVKRRERGPVRVGELVIALAAKGLATGEIRSGRRGVMARRCRGRRSRGSPAGCWRRWAAGSACPLERVDPLIAASEHAARQRFDELADKWDER
jgi:hypothetical protein